MEREAQGVLRRHRPHGRDGRGDRAGLPAEGNRRGVVPVPAGGRARARRSSSASTTSSRRTRRRSRFSTSTRRRATRSWRGWRSCERRATTTRAPVARRAAARPRAGDGQHDVSAARLRPRVRDGRRDVRRAARGVGRVRGSADHLGCAELQLPASVRRLASCASWTAAEPPWKPEAASWNPTAMQDSSRHREAGPRRPRPRRQGHRARAARRGHGGHLHRACARRRSRSSAAALQEDADVIGLSILSGAHMHICPRVMELLKEKGLDDVLVVVGGIIPDVDIPKLQAMGVDGHLPARARRCRTSSTSSRRTSGRAPRRDLAERVQPTSPFCQRPAATNRRLRLPPSVGSRPAPGRRGATFPSRRRNSPSGASRPERARRETRVGARELPSALAAAQIAVRRVAAVAVDAAAPSGRSRSRCSRSA